MRSLRVFVITATLFLAAFTTLSTTSAQAGLTPALEWDTYYTGGEEWYASFAAVKATSDGGLITVGSYDLRFWVLKTDASGAVEWENIYPLETTYRAHAYARDVIELPGGGYALLGMTHAPVPYDPQGAYRIGVVVHLDENGNKTGEYPVDDGWYPRNYANMYFTADNDVILTGACDPNQMPYRYYCNQRSDIHGNIEWSIMLPWYESARLYKAADKPGGGFFTADNIDNGDGTYSLEVTALDDSANVEWHRATPYEGLIAPHVLSADGAGGLFLGGRYEDDSGNLLISVGRVNSEGGLLWYSNTPNCLRVHTTKAIIPAEDGGLFYVGNAYGDPSYGYSSNKIYVARFDAQGNLTGDYLYTPMEQQSASAATAVPGGLVLAGLIDLPEDRRYSGLLARFYDLEVDGAPEVCEWIPAESEVIEVTIDILPGNHRNTLNPTKQGALAVAILSNAGFDALTVDPATAELSGALAQMRGKRWFTQDKDVDGDGIYDLVLHFDCGLLNLENSENNLTLTAQTYAGEIIAGGDSVTLVKEK